jgi:hypothetical protein
MPDFERVAIAHPHFKRLERLTPEQRLHGFGVHSGILSLEHAHFKFFTVR